MHSVGLLVHCYIDSNFGFDRKDFKKPVQT